jgi:hypothetical protein
MIWSMDAIRPVLGRHVRRRRTFVQADRCSRRKAARKHAGVGPQPLPPRVPPWADTRTRAWALPPLPPRRRACRSHRRRCCKHVHTRYRAKAARAGQSSREPDPVPRANTGWSRPAVGRNRENLSWTNMHSSCRRSCRTHRPRKEASSVAAAAAPRETAQASWPRERAPPRARRSREQATVGQPRRAGAATSLSIPSKRLGKKDKKKTVGKP